MCYSNKSNEVVLFFDKVDDVNGPIRAGLGMTQQRCCDGIIFYAKKDEDTTRIVICLVEMKHTDMSKAQEQIEQTYNRLLTLLRSECILCTDYLRQIVWQAYIYYSGAAPRGGYRDIEKALKGKGFKEAWVRNERDITEYLRMEIGASLRNNKTRIRGR